MRARIAKALSITVVAAVLTTGCIRIPGINRTQSQGDVWEVTEHSAGPIRLGMSAPEVLKTFGYPTKAFELFMLGTAWMYDDFEVFLSSEGMVWAVRVWRPFTFKGLSYGKSTRSEVLAALGKPRNVYLWTDDKDRVTKAVFDFGDFAPVVDPSTDTLVGIIIQDIKLLGRLVP